MMITQRCHHGRVVPRMMNNSPWGSGRALDGVFWDERVRACRPGDATRSLFDHWSYSKYYVKYVKL
jgi:hypothetical protein